MKKPSIKRSEKRGDRKIDVEMEKVVSSQERTGLRAHKLHKKYMNQEFSQTTSCYVSQDQPYSRQVMKGVLKMINVETSISINRPIEEVFVSVSDHQHHQTRRKSCHP